MMKGTQSETAILRIQMLGPFKIWHQKNLLEWPTQKSKALFQILLIEPGRLVPTDQIIEYLWPDLQPRKAKNNLWVTISQLRRVLEPNLPARASSAYILKVGEGYRFNDESNYWLDCESFTTNLTISQSTTNLSEGIAAWEAALSLYQGNYIEDEPYAEWVQLARTQWQRRYEQLLKNLAKANEQNGDIQQAINYCRKFLALDNTNETIYRLLMHCHISLGERGPALKVYNEVVQVLQKEIGVDPMPETTELAHQIEQLEGDWRFDAKETQVSSPFIGRRKEIDLFNQLLAQSATGVGRILIFTGEPGIGKTRLVQETNRLASGKGFRSFTAQCYQLEQALPYQPFIDLARQIMEHDQHWQQLASVWLRELALLVPEMEAVAVEAMTTAPLSDELDESQQGRLFQAIFKLFAIKSKQYKLLLVIEDIQWADITTLQCLHYLSRHITQVPITIIFTLREENLATNTDLVALLDNLRREKQVRSLSLSRLTQRETKALLMKSADTARYSDQFGNWLYQETAGHPFFLTSILQSIREGGLLEDAGKTDWPVLSQTDPALALPDAIRDSVLSRLQRLSQIEREVLDWMSVYGRSFNFSTLTAISSQPKITLLNAVEQLTALQLLEESKGQYDFNHNKIREVVYQDLSASRRTLYHQQIGSSLETMKSMTEKSAILAYHFERGEEHEIALDYWMQAGAHALDTYAYQSAVYLFERALTLSNKPADKMDTYHGLGNAHLLLDDHKAATEFIQQGIQLAEDHSDELRRAKLLYLNAQNASRQHRSNGGEPEAQAALLAAKQVGDNNYLAQSLLLLTEAHESKGDLNNALETATRAQIVSSQLNNKQLEARALVEIGFLYAQQAAFDKAARAAEQGLELLANTNDYHAIAYAWNILGRALGGRGEYSSALDAFQQSQQEAEKVCDRYLLAQALNMRGWLYRELGNYENALKFDQEGVDFAQEWGKPSPEISARLNVCLNVLHLGNPKQALEMLNIIETQINDGAFGFHKWRWQLRLQHARGFCFINLSRPEDALACAIEGLLLAETNNTRKYIALNHELKGKALAEMGDIRKAITAMEAGIVMADEIQYQPIRWGTRLQLAELYKQTGRDEEAKQILAQAGEIIQAIATPIENESLRNTFLNTAYSK